MSLTCARKWLGGTRVLERSIGKDAAHPKHGGDELRELAETFRQTVERLSSLVQQLEAAHQETLRAEREKKQFYHEVIRSFTNGKFDLVDPGEVPDRGQLAADLPVRDGREYAAARIAIQEAARAAGLSEERTTDLLLAAGEAISNVLKHATEGRCLVFRSENAVTVRIADRGGGIVFQNLPATILLAGFSTKVSLGMGYKMMLQLCDHVWLSTGPEGTTVQLEMSTAAPARDDRLAAWARM